MESREIKAGDLVRLRRSLFKGHVPPTSIYLVVNTKERKSAEGVLLDVQKIGESRILKGFVSDIYEVYNESR
jgi:hypothetical protein